MEIVNKYGNHTAEAYRGSFKVLVASQRPTVEKYNQEHIDDDEICTRPSAPPVKRPEGYMSTKSTEYHHIKFLYDRTLCRLPVTLPKIELRQIRVPEPKLVRRPSLLEKEGTKDGENKGDAAERLATHLSEYECGRLGESLGVSRGLYKAYNE